MAGPASPVPSYASTRLIAYLGNKRSLLPRLRELFLGILETGPAASFLDPFAGSGSVARLARSLGWRVMACDSEEYARALNACWLGVTADDLPVLFRREGGLGAVLQDLNALHPSRGDAAPPGGEPVPYIAAHYAPARTDRPDWRRERLFYTAENARFLDRARCAIDVLRPPAGASGAGGARGADPRSPGDAERALLLGPLLYEAGTHANTSGVFKACHKGFGGHGGDALGRIMAPMLLEAPLLWPGPPAEVVRADALDFCAARGADLCYLDPPYNQHQYGSNYHLLNTIARWDREPVSAERDGEGRLVEKAGIPASWKESRSAFCSRPLARAAFEALFDAIDARTIILSYNEGGIVPAGELHELLARHAEVQVLSEEYVAYRGGRQSVGRSARSRELLFVARRGQGRGRGLPASCDAGPCKPDIIAGTDAAAGTLDALRSELRLARALAAVLDPGLVRAEVPDAAGEAGVLARSGSTLLFGMAGGGEVQIGTRALLLVEGTTGLEGLGPGERIVLAGQLEAVAAPDHGAACAAALGLLEEGPMDLRVAGAALGFLRKLAHPRTAAEFAALSRRFEALAPCQLSAGLKAKYARLRSQAEKRLAGAPRPGERSRRKNPGPEG